MPQYASLEAADSSVLAIVSHLHNYSYFQKYETRRRIPSRMFTKVYLKSTNLTGGFWAVAAEYRYISGGTPYRATCFDTRQGFRTTRILFRENNLRSLMEHLKGNLPADHILSIRQPLSNPDRFAESPNPSSASDRSPTPTAHMHYTLKKASDW